MELSIWDNNDYVNLVDRLATWKRPGENAYFYVDKELWQAHCMTLFETHRRYIHPKAILHFDKVIAVYHEHRYTPPDSLIIPSLLQEDLEYLKKLSLCFPKIFDYPRNREQWREIELSNAA